MKCFNLLALAGGVTATAQPCADIETTQDIKYNTKYMYLLEQTSARSIPATYLLDILHYNIGSPTLAHTGTHTVHTPNNQTDHAPDRTRAS